jgi:hypothetical protein
MWHKVFQANSEEVGVLRSFINLKEWQLDRHTRLNAAKDLIQMYQTVIVETKAFIEYLKEFPSKDRTMVHVSAKFWWTTPHDKMSDGNKSCRPHIAEDLTEILSCFPTVEHHGYFGPKGQAPREDGLQRLVTKKKRMLLPNTLQSLPSLGLHQPNQF